MIEEQDGKYLGGLTPLPEDIIRDKIKNIDEHRAHETAEMMCVKCYYRYQGVWPEQTLLKNLECPHCKKTGGIIKTGQTIFDT